MQWWKEEETDGRRNTALILLTAVMGDSSIGQAASIAEK